jgi:hypothetical protein
MPTLRIGSASAQKFRQVDFDGQNVALLTPRAGHTYWIDPFRRGVGRFSLSSGHAGDKRDDMSACSLRIDKRPRLSPACHLAWDSLRPESGGVVFSKLSKLLNQEDALGAPWLRHLRNYRGAIRSRGGVFASLLMSP